MTTVLHPSSSRPSHPTLLRRVLLAAVVASAWPATAAFALAFDIPPQALDTTLTDIARQSGLQFMLPADLTQASMAPAVRGEFDPMAALRVALTGSGLEAIREGSTVMIRRSVQSAPPYLRQLETISVVGKGNAITEGTGSYTTGAMTTATKLPMSIRDTPQSLSVVTRQKIDDFSMRSIDDVMNATTGISINRWSDDRSRFFSRGFVISSVLLDGAPVSYETDTSTYSTMAMYDRVEVVRGPTGLMTGMGDPSGTINFVRKRPTRTSQFSVTARAGTWDHLATELDASGPLNAEGTLRGRAVTALQNNNNFLDDYSNRKRLLYGTLEMDVTPDTTLSVGGFTNNERNPGSQWNGVATAPDGSFLNVSRSMRFSPSWSYWHKKEASAFAELEHRFDGGWKGKLTSRTLRATSALAGAYLIDGSYSPEGRIQYNVAGGEYDYSKNQLSLDASAQGPVTVLGRRHDLAFGISRRSVQWRDEGRSYTDPEGNVEVVSNIDPYTYDWDSLIRKNITLDSLWTRRQKSTLSSAYATGRFNLADPLNVVLGARYDWFAFDNVQNQGTWSKQRDYSTNAHFTPYAAVIFDLNDEHSVYASYASIFKPQDYLNTAGQMLPPVEGNNYELGLKASYLDERINAAIALFSTTQSNLAQTVGDIETCAVRTNCYRSVGEVASRGIDMDVNGELLPRLNVGVGYTYTRATIATDSDEGAKGSPYASYIPQHLFKVSAMYHLTGDFEKWRIGGAVRAQGKTTSESSTRNEGYLIKQSPFGVVDLSVGYAVSKAVDVQLNIHNLFDKTYYETLAVRNGANFFGAPRQVLARLRATF